MSRTATYYVIDLLTIKRCGIGVDLKRSRTVLISRCGSWRTRLAFCVRSSDSWAVRDRRRCGALSVGGATAIPMKLPVRNRVSAASAVLRIGTYLRLYQSRAAIVLNLVPRARTAMRAVLGRPKPTVRRASPGIGPDNKVARHYEPVVMSQDRGSSP